MTVRTRFAPSPTGTLHIGGARTALFCWLFARHHKGQAILRIEDTDRARSTQASLDNIVDSVSWLGLDYDEGPLYQTQRTAEYQAAIDALLSSNQAYRCYCSKARLEQLRAAHMARQEKPRYDGHCRNRPTADTEDAPFVVRFRQPDSGTTAFEDQVHGTISTENHELDDLIIARTDGTPTYNLTVVVDDAAMRITHVIRGDDHINNTPRQIQLFHALGITPPIYAHVPMILGEDGKRLSKRHNAPSVLEYRDTGFLPEALLNYLVRLGWSYGDQEIFSRQEMIDHFTLSGINNSAARINPEKSLWINQHHLKALPIETLGSLLAEALSTSGIDTQAPGMPHISAVAALQQDRAKTLHTMAENSRFFYTPVTIYDAKACKKHITPATETALKQVRQALETRAEWEPDALHTLLAEHAEKLQLTMGQIAQPLRIALTGNTVSPSINQCLAVMGKKRVLERIDQAIACGWTS